MIYKNELSYLSRSVADAWSATNTRKLKPFKGSASFDKKLPASPVDDSAKEREVSAWAYWSNICRRSGIHGLQYLGSEKVHFLERVIWATIVIASVSLVTYMCNNLTRRYREGYISTTVQSTIYPVYKIPFPAVTICTRNRLNWNRLDKAKRRFLGRQADPPLQNLFEQYLAALDVLEFGYFAPMKAFNETSLKPLDHINFTAVAEYMAPNCSEIFIGECWWMTRYFPCCDIFVRQRTEVGFCHSFNSMSSEAAFANAKRLGNNVPWRTARSGFYGGLRVHVNLEMRKDREAPSNGITVIVGHPDEWPSWRKGVPPYTETAVVIKPNLSFLMNDTKSVPIEARGCLFAEDGYENVESLPGLVYTRDNCFSQCHQRYSMERCNCSIEMFFPTGDNPICRASDMPCFVRNEEVLMYDKYPEEDKYIGVVEGMTCRCMYECQQVVYNTQLQPYPLVNRTEQIILDVHFGTETLMFYTGSVQFPLTALMVSIGGIAGLFLGCSLISGIELVYYATVGLFVYWYDRKYLKRRMRTSWRKVNRILVRAKTNGYL